jgi:hypothetical protein
VIGRSLDVVGFLFGDPLVPPFGVRLLVARLGRLGKFAGFLQFQFLNERVSVSFCCGSASEKVAGAEKFHDTTQNQSGP